MTNAHPCLLGCVFYLRMQARHRKEQAGMRVVPMQARREKGEPKMSGVRK
ncbi:MAG: hypothetical protein ACPGWR_24905 [Ardenticatenaceae bacterium]